MLKEILFVFAAYAMGCLSIGYYLVRLLADEDIRATGSGSAGATNVGREFGAGGFIATILLDSAKGAGAVWAAFHFGLGASYAMLILVAVVAGHIWPVQLGFRGGKGVSPTLGGILIFDSRLAAVLTVLCGIAFIFTRRFALSGLLAVILAPGAAWFLGYPPEVWLAMAGLVTILLIAHRENLQAIAAKNPQSGRIKLPLVRRAP